MSPAHILRLSLAAAVALALGACDGDPEPRSTSGAGGAPGDRPGFWFEDGGARLRDATGSLGYASGYEPAEERWTGLRVHDPERAFLEPMLLSSGHEPAAFVLHPDGTLERRWALEDAPNLEALGPRFQHPTQRAWRRVEPLEGGDLLVIHEGLCLLRLGPDSTIRWRAVPGAHHDLEVDGDTLWALDRAVGAPTDAELRWRPDAAPLVTRDGLVRVRLSDGEVLARASLTELPGGEAWEAAVGEALRRARRVDIGDTGPGGALRLALDPLHTNAVARLDPSRVAPTLFLRELGALVDLSDDLTRIERLRRTPFAGAHDPQLDPEDGRVLLFDNLGARAVPRSRVLSLDLTTGDVRTEFEGDDGEPFFSPVCGAVLPLPGGRLLVLESTAGRALQVDRSGRVLWEFRTPFRIPEEDLVAVLLDMRPL